ncbi:MAG: nucleotidyltransferase domain-containing protein [Actinobacteria bacterium]|nr:nucleotidyltransferase domain-containing protein [Actinomycetota bacterium]
MDFRQPVHVVIPGAQGRILAVLSQTAAELNLRTIARLSGVSVAQASRVMPGLVELGLVERREAPPSALFRFVPNHVASRAVAMLADARTTVLQELKLTAGRLRVPPVSVIVYGSFARGEADRSSDIDILLIRPPRVDEDDPQWRAGIDEWLEGARRLTGNRVELLEFAAEEAGAKLRSKRQLWSNIQREGIVVQGRTIEALQDRRSA